MPYTGFGRVLALFDKAALLRRETGRVVSGRRGSPRLTVGAWPARLNNNSYNEQLYRQMAREVDILSVEADRASIRLILRRRVDILHIHWIDRVLWRKKRKRMRVIGAMIAILIIALLVRMKGGRIVWTAHDPEPHDLTEAIPLQSRAVKLAWRIYHRAITALVDHVVVMSESHKAPLSRSGLRRRCGFHFVPLPDYRGTYADSVSRQRARCRLDLPADAPLMLFLGNVRPYKGVAKLVAAFEGLEDEDARLVIAGRLFGGEGFTSAIRNSVADDPRIIAHFEVIPDDELQHFLRAADLFVAPFDAVTNSGSVLLALSFDCPVLVPDVPIFRELRAVVGGQWVRLFEGTLSAEALGEAQHWACTTDRPKSPDMQMFDKETVARSTVAVYRKALGLE